MLAECAQMANERDPLERWTEIGISDFRVPVRRVWHWTYEDVKALSPSTAPHRSLILERWLDLGRQCDIDVDAPYEPEADVAGGRRSEKRSKVRSCAWKDCLCFGQKPHHKLKTCTKCYKVFYCSRKCQKK